jgi:hypothetical protein
VVGSLIAHFSTRVRCDRQLPCSTCSRRGFAQSCAYDPGASESIIPRSAGTVHERLHQLESLVVNLMHQNRGPSPALAQDCVLPTPTSQVGSSSHIACSKNKEAEQSSETTASASNTGNLFDIDFENSPALMDCGSMNPNGSGTANYVGGAHWATILDSIAELKDQVAEEEQMALDIESSAPQLLYGCRRATKEQILSSIQPREVMDQLVSNYFTLDVSPGGFTTSPPGVHCVIENPSQRYLLTHSSGSAQGRIPPRGILC